MAVTRGNVCQTPDCFKLKLGRLDALAELEEARDQVAINRLLDGRVRLERQQLTKACHCQDLHDLNVGCEQVDNLVEVRLLTCHIVSFLDDLLEGHALGLRQNLIDFAARVERLVTKGDQLL